MSKKSDSNKDSDSSAAYKSGDIVLSKIRGFPPWPAMVMQDSDIPEHVMKERPTGKKAKFFCVRFFPAGDFSWAIPKDMSLLQKHEIEAYIQEPHKKSSELLEGYKVALDPESWLKEKEEERKAREEDDADAEVDQLEGEEESEESGSKKKKASSTTGKRKREPAPAKEKKEKKEKEKKEKETNGTTTERKKRGPKKNEAKSKENVESEDEATGKPASKRAKRGSAKEKDKEAAAKENAGDEEDDSETKKVKEWRHALQRAFLGKVKLKGEDMTKQDELFKEVEAYDEMALKHLQSSKIGKVMRHIAALSPAQVPRDDDFNFRLRANALVEKWHKIVAPNDSTANGDLTKADIEVPSETPKE